MAPPEKFVGVGWSLEEDEGVLLAWRERRDGTVEKLRVKVSGHLLEGRGGLAVTEAFLDEYNPTKLRVRGVPNAEEAGKGTEKRVRLISVKTLFSRYELTKSLDDAPAPPSVADNDGANGSGEAPLVAVVRKVVREEVAAAVREELADADVSLCERDRELLNKLRNYWGASISKKHGPSVAERMEAILSAMESIARKGD